MVFYINAKIECIIYNLQKKSIIYFQITGFLEKIYKNIYLIPGCRILDLHLLLLFLFAAINQYPSKFFY